MISEKQLQANRQNAQKSTGPKTAEGKAIASRNSIRHGLLSKEMVIKGEDAGEFEDLRDRLMTHYAPSGELEILITERIVADFWKLRRGGRLETELINYLLTKEDTNSSGSPVPRMVVIRLTGGGSESTQESSPDSPNSQVPSELDGRIEEDSWAPGNSLQKQPEQPKPLGRMVYEDFTGSQVMSRLRRYEGELLRSLFRTTAELQRYQTARKRNEAILAKTANPGAPGLTANS